MRRPLILLLAGLTVLLAGAAATWLLRFRITDGVVERRLAAAGVSAAYRLTRLGPFRQRIEDVRIGDPAAPDLTAGRIDLEIGYSLRGPVVRAIRAQHVRLRGRIDRTGLSLGMLDRLLPRTGGGAALPDLQLVLADARVALATPNGAALVRLDGAGNPQRVFRGRARLAAPALRIADCRLADVRADLALAARAGAVGTVGIGRTRCPDVALGFGALRLAARSNAGMRQFAGRAAPSGFAGEAGGLRIHGLTGVVQGGGRIGALDLAARLSLASLSVSAAVRAVRAIPGMPGTPVGRTLARGRAAVVALLARSDAEVDAALRVRDRTVQADLKRLVLRGEAGGRLVAGARDGLSWTERGFRLDGDVSIGGGALPALAVQLRQTSVGAPLRGYARLDPYRAGNAVLAVPGVSFRWAGRRLALDGRLRLDGPVGDGELRGLDVPVRGWIDADGALAFGQGCQAIVAARARFTSVTFSRIRLPVCGRPIVARSAAGRWRLAGATGPLLLGGRIDDGAAVTVTAAATRLSGERFAIGQVRATIGATQLAVARLDGALTGSGSFAGVAARIGAVPLALDKGDGRWRFADGALHIAGDLRVSDTAASPRFRPLDVSGATLTFRGGAIAAEAVLREPASRAMVANVALTHDLTRGTGGARLVVSELRFVPKGLQPDAVTPLTLGVIANASGSVSGRGRVDWSAQGVASSGSFRTDGLDFAAAFGPVTGLKGRLDFTDLLGLVSAPGQVATVAEINPGIAIAGGVVRFHLPGQNRVAVDDARWPFAGGTLRLEPAVIDLAADRERRLTFRLEALDAGAFVQQLDLPNVSAAGTFDGVLPMAFGQFGGRIERGTIAARASGGTIAYVGELTTASLGTMGKLAFDALKAIRYSTLTVDLDGQLDGEMVSRVRFAGVREATPEQSLVARLIRGLPFRFNIAIRAPFRGLVGTARSYADPSLLLRQAQRPPVQQPASGPLP